MRLVISGQEYYCDNKELTAAQIMGKVLEISQSDNLVLSHMRIDGVNVYSNVESYLEEHFSTIECAEAVFVTVPELLHDIFDTTSEYLDRAIPELQELSEECYKAPNTGTWNKLGQLLEAIQWFQQTAIFVEEHRESIPDSFIHEKTFDFTNETSMLQEAVEQQDFILLGDIIQFEILTKFQEIAHQLQKMTSVEVDRHDLN
ncbi:hypothetical protein [Brevibacillus borstelensis]|uniref:hypothetical protein n=1 Tax=Brevibacillus borstelensis TaxID=45462 RepID=UPI003CF8D61E